MNTENQTPLPRHQDILPYLRGKTLDEQRQFLRDIQYPAHEIEDYLAFVNTPRMPAAPKTKTASSIMDDPKYQAIFARIEQHRENLRNNPQIQQENQQSRFERDVLHNRHLLGGPTVLDGASVHNPNFRQTDIWQHLWNEFRPGHYRSLLLLGSPGNGKTFTALAYLNTIAEVKIELGKVQHSNAIFIKPYRICEMLADQKRWTDELKDLRRTKILLLDDLGTEPTGFKGADFVAFMDDLFDERSKRPQLITIFTTNGTIESVKDANGAIIKPGIKVLYGDRFASRFSGSGYYYESKGADLRVGVHG